MTAATKPQRLNESLAKLLCHNVCCLISAWYELGIEPTFGEKPPDDEPKNLLRFPVG